MKIYFFLLLAMAALLLALFALTEGLDLALLTNPEPWLGAGGWAAVTGIGLLVADVLIPVPSSLIMIAHGAAFGVLLGTLFSLAGSLGAAWVGFGLGRSGGPFLQRFLPAAEGERVSGLVERWGGLAVVVTRPIPILAESVAILAGTTRLSWLEMTLATLLGALPVALLYALSGAAILLLINPLWILLAVLLLASPAWFLSRSSRLRSWLGAAGQTSDSIVESSRRIR